MTRVQLLQLLVQQARESGFMFRKWFTATTAVTWTGPGDAIAWLSRGERALLLIFSRGFARHFWRSGERVTFLVPQQTFERVTPQGGTRTIQRKAHMRRSSREDVWRFHLREMAASAEPLRYIRRFLVVQEVVNNPDDDGESPLQKGDGNTYDEELMVREEDQPKSLAPARVGKKPSPEKARFKV
jgi:hypothetical protein